MRGGCGHLVRERGAGSLVAEVHVRARCQLAIPTQADWLRKMKPRHWMGKSWRASSEDVRELRERAAGLANGRGVATVVDDLS